jgi:hypothetical protein
MKRTYGCSESQRAVMPLIMSTLMMEAKIVAETDYNVILTQLIGLEDFIAFSRRESFKSYKEC